MPSTFLIAAHDPWFIQLLRVYTQETGYRVIHVYEGQDVIPTIWKEHPTALLLQADLPGLIKSKEIVKTIKSFSDFQNLPVLVFFTQFSANENDLTDCDAVRLNEPISFLAFQDALVKAGLPIQSPSPGPSLGHNPGKKPPSTPPVKKNPGN